MPDANALTLAELRTATLGRRFPITQAGSADRWLATAYTDVWNAADWTFKRVDGAALAVVAADANPAMPSDYRDTISLYDDRGIELRRYSEEEFNDLYMPDVAAGYTGIVEAFAVVNRQIILGPAPTASVSFRHSYSRRVSHLQADGTTVSGGFMDEDDDYPLWSDHHALLIPRAQAIGLEELSDPTADLAQAEYARQLDRMIDDYGTSLVGQWGPASQWGGYA